MICLLFIVLCLSAGTVSGSQCFQGWYFFEGSCYGFGDTLISWGDAEDICEASRGKLAEIETASENDFLQVQARHKGASAYWLGATDVFHKGTWRWISTGQVANFTDWNTGEPSDYSGHATCLSLMDSADYKWADNPCDQLHAFICEAIPEEGIVVG